MPVLPLVGSMIVPPGCSVPSASAASIMASAMRSLIEPPGLPRSLLTQTSWSGNRRESAHAACRQWLRESNRPSSVTLL
jgi:hypothetical protein